MRVFNKFVESKTEPWNKQDIWYDGSIIKLYKEGKWEEVTVDLETVNKLREFVDKFEMFKLVDELPEVGNPNTVYLILSKNAVDKNTLSEYIYINDTWEEIGGSIPYTIFEKGGGEDSAVLKQTDEKEKNTSTGKANIVGGRRNNVASHTSIAGGVDNVIRGSNSLVVGSNNNAYQRDSLVEGYYNITHDVYSHAEGHSNSSRGTASHVEGSYNETTNNNEHAQGKYNKSNTGTIHSVGIGTSNTDRKNAHEIMQDGKHYIYGIGGYDGTNPTESINLARVIEKLQKTLKYSSLTIIIEDWEDFYNKFNQVSYDEAKNNIINVRYGDGSLGNLTLWELCDNLMSFSKIDVELKNGNTDKKLQGSYLSRTFNSNNDDCSYEFIFGSIIPDEYGVMIHMVGDSTNECYVNIFEI